MKPKGSAGEPVHASGSGRYTFEKEGIQGLCEALEDDDTRLRQLAALFLGETGKEKVVDHLLRALRDPEKRVRARATDALVKIGTPAVDSLIALLSDENWVIRYRAAEALGRIGDARAVDPLVAALADPKDHVRYMAAKGIGFLNEGRTLEPLIALFSDENEYVRRSAATAVGALGGKDAGAALESALSRESDAGVRDAILNALDGLS